VIRDRFRNRPVYGRTNARPEIFEIVFHRMANPWAKYNEDDSAASPISRIGAARTAAGPGIHDCVLPDEFHLPDYTLSPLHEELHPCWWDLRRALADSSFHIIVSYFGTIDRYVIATGKDIPACLDHGPSGGTSPN
jgi:hypothetical protein